jgi:cytidine deaminase
MQSPPLPWDELAATAWTVRDFAHAPYSKFHVGAALLAADGRIFTGCNVENLSFGLTMCAERVAIGSAIAAGAKEFLALVVVADTREPISPCGACRQVMAEFGDFPVRTTNRSGQSVEHPVSIWLPRAATGILDRTTTTP